MMKNQDNFTIGVWDGRVRIESRGASFTFDADSARRVAQALLTQAKVIDGIEAVILQPGELLTELHEQEPTE